MMADSSELFIMAHSKEVGQLITHLVIDWFLLLCHRYRFNKTERFVDCIDITDAAMRCAGGI